MKLPESHEKNNTLENMEDYTYVYVTPRTMRVDMSGNCKIYEDASGDENSGGTLQLKITKVPEGYIAHINEMEKEYKWEMSSEPSYILGDLTKCYGQVVAFNVEDYCKEYNVSPKNFLLKTKIGESEQVIENIVRSFKQTNSKN